jgi:hypothetical protein
MDMDWTEIGKGGKQSRKKTDKDEPRVDHQNTNTNTFSLLVKDGEEEVDMESEADTDEDNVVADQLDNEAVEKKEKTKDMNSLARKERRDQVTHFNQMRRDINKRDVWTKKERRTILDAFLKPLLKLGYGVAGDALQDLLRLTDHQIRDTVALSIAGEVEEAAEKENVSGGEITKTATPPHREEGKGEEIPPVVEQLSPQETDKAKQDTDEFAGLWGDILAMQDEKTGDSTGGTPQTPIFPHKDKPPEEPSIDATLHDTEVKQSNSKNTKNNITDFFRPSPPLAENDLR